MRRRTPRRKRFTPRLFRLFVRGDRNNKQASSVSLSPGKSASTGYASLLLRFGRFSTFDGSMQINRLSPCQKNICYMFASSRGEFVSIDAASFKNFCLSSRHSFRIALKTAYRFIRFPASIRTRFRFELHPSLAPSSTFPSFETSIRFNFPL